MRSFAFLYSATVARDYGLVASPGISIVPKEVIRIFRLRVRGLLSDEEPIDVPRWLLLKEFHGQKTYILWGMGCMNSMLSPSFSKDNKHRAIQCFTGCIIIDPEINLRLPYDVESFVPLFNEVMSNRWESFDPKSLEMEYPIDRMKAGHYIKGKSGLNLNYNSMSCRFFPASANPDGVLFSEAIWSDRSVSLASNIVRKSEVVTPEFIPLLNAVYLKETDEIKDISVKHQCSRCKQNYMVLHDGLCETCYMVLHPDNPTKNTEENHSVIHENSHTICSRCGKEVARINQDGICEDCYKKASRRRMIYIVVLAVIGLIFWVLAVNKFSFLFLALFD